MTLMRSGMPSNTACSYMHKYHANWKKLLFLFGNMEFAHYICKMLVTFMFNDKQ